MIGALRRLFWSEPSMGQVCPSCARYDWAQQPIRGWPCRCGGHQMRECSTGCGFVEVLPDFGPACDD